MRGYWGFLLTFVVASAWAQSDAVRFQTLLEQDWEYVLEHAPEFSTYVGDPRYNDRWSDRSLDAVKRWEDHDVELLNQLKDIDRETLSAADRLNYDLFRYNTEMDVAGHSFPEEYLPVNQLGGVQQQIADLVNRMPAQTVEQFEDIVARLSTANEPIEQTIARMQWGLELGVTPPAITLRDVPDQIRAQIVDDPAASPIYQPFQSMPDEIPMADQERLRQAAQEAIAQFIVPAYQKMHAFVVNEYLPSARDSIALVELPDGDAWYRWRVRQMTTTELTPRQIHELGLR